MEKGQILELRTEDITGEGMGVGRADGIAVFVEGTVLGDIVKVEVTQVKKRYAMARATEIVVPSEERCEPICGSDCGGCALRETKYETQLKIKEKQVRDKLERLAGIAHPNVLPIIGAAQPFHYRNKAQFQVGEKNGKSVVGFYKKRTHSIDECADCAIQSASAMTAARILQDFMRKECIKAYDKKSGKGLIRNLIVKTAVHTGEVMVILVATDKRIPKIEELVSALDEAVYAIPWKDGAYYSLESVIVNVNKKNAAEILGDVCIDIAGKPFVAEKTCGLDFEISPLAFYQVNPEQVEKLYGQALAFANLQGDETVFDLYCGVGTIGLLCAQRMAQRTEEKYGEPNYEKMGTVYGVESVKGAGLDANRNAVINGIVNARFFCGKAEDKIADLLAGNIAAGEDEHPAVRPDVVILDPPRAGCDPALLQAVSEAKPQRIVYVSCDPGTMARDVKLLVKSGYRLEAAQPVDMFPWTGSVETVVLLSHKKADTYINVNVEFGEGEGKIPIAEIAKKAEEYRPSEKVTYKMIKEYIENKYGFKVHTAYIAEVKRGLGLPMYDAPNAVEELKQPRKHPTPKMAEAIKDALKYFGII